MRAGQLGQQAGLTERAGRGAQRIGDAVGDQHNRVLRIQVDARLGVGLVGHDPQRRARRRDHLLRVAARALDEGAQVAGAGDGHRARQRIDPHADRGHEQVGLVAGDDRVVQQREDGAWLLAAREVLPHAASAAATPERPRSGRCRRRRREHRDMTLAMLDDLEEVAAVAEGSVLPGGDAQLAPRRQMHQLRPAGRRPVAR